MFEVKFNFWKPPYMMSINYKLHVRQYLHYNKLHNVKII